MFNDELDPTLRPGSAESRLTLSRFVRGSPAPSSSGASSPDESDQLDDEVAAARSITQPALVTPTALSSPGSPWPFGGVLAPGAPRRGEGDPSFADLLAHSSSRVPGTAIARPGRPKPSSLPHEILLHILKLVHATSDLRTCLTVCKSWCQCGVELLWHKPSFHHVKLLQKALVVLKRKDQTFPYSMFIKRLNFSALAPEGITDGILQQLVACERLERLTIAGNVEVTDEGIGDILSVCHNLVALDVSECVNVSDATCRAAANSCRLLQGLNLSGCKLVSDEGVIAIAESCTALRRIKMRQLNQITDAPLQMLARHCSHLLEVDIVNCEKVTDAALWDIWRSLSHLREFSLAGCTRITDEALPQREKVGHKWQIMLKGEAMVPARPTQSDIPDPPPGAFQPRMELIPTPVSQSNFTHLRYLDLTSLNHLTDTGIEGIVSCIPKIRNLILAKCGRLTDESLRSVSKLGKHLHYLHLGHVNLITDAAVTTLARSCTRLRYIDLACCPNLTDMSVTELATNLVRLKRIGLVRVTRLTDNAIAALQERTSLERIHLSYCESITVQAIAFLLVRLRKLTHLSLTGVPSFRRPELQKFCRSPPKDFNAHQRQAFCVYSGSGVAALREYLSAVIASRQAHYGGPTYFADFDQQNGFADPRDARRFPRVGMGPGGTNQFIPFVPGQGHFLHPGQHAHHPQTILPGHAMTFDEATQAATMAALQQDMDEDDGMDEDEDDDDSETVAGSQHLHHRYRQHGATPTTTGNPLATLAAAAATVGPTAPDDSATPVQPQPSTSRFGARWWHGGNLRVSRATLAGPSSAPAASTSTAQWPAHAGAAAASTSTATAAGPSAMPADEEEYDEDSGDDPMEVDGRA